MFDGDLPLSKRDVRLERMKNSVKQLEVYKALNPHLPPLVLPEYATLPKLWQRASKPSLVARTALPPPPFLIPAAMQDLMLLHPSWKVQIVPEEADIACARTAKATRAAILTNDSDLTVFDLGQDGCVIVLRTLSVTEIDPLSLTQEGPMLPVLRITASCVRSSRIAQRLGLASFSRLAFERHLDSDASLSTIKERARDDFRHENLLASYNDFSKQYDISELEPEPDSLDRLDPRTAEFIVQACRPRPDKSPHVYFPVLHDDPAEYSSWNYGSDYRKFGYTMFYYLQKKWQRPESVVEHFRKGSQVSATYLSFFGEVGLKTNANALLEAFGTFLNPKYRVPVCIWHALALHYVIEYNLCFGRAPFTHQAVDGLFGTKTDATPAPFIPTWGDTHLLANAQAVLYSLRMLRQILSRTLGEETSHLVLSKEIENIQVYLCQMPTPKDLFLNLHELRSCRVEERVRAANLVKKALEEAGVKAEEPVANESKRARKKRKNSSKPAASEKRLAGNAFSILSEHMDEAEDMG